MKNIIKAVCLFAVAASLSAMAQTEMEDKFDAIGGGNALGLAGLDPAIYFGLDLNDGNTENLGVNLGLTGKGAINEGSELLFGIEGNYKEDTIVRGGDSETTTQTIDADAQYNYLFNDPWYAYANVKGFHDSIAEIDYRVNVGPGVGYYFIKDAIAELAVEAGPGYQFEDAGGESFSDPTWRAAQRYSRQINDKTRVFQDLEYIPILDDWGDYTLNGQVGLETELANGYGLRVALKGLNDSTPAVIDGLELEDTDLNLQVGLLKSL